MSYSQRDEEPAILKAFGDKADGRFLDVGAFDGKTFSNTLALVERGWSGVCVEPSPTVFPALLELHGGNERVSLVQAVVASQWGWVEFWDSGGDAISTTVEAHRDLWRDKGAKNYRTVTMPAITPANLLARFPGPFDLVNIDTEGTSTDLFRLFWGIGLRPRVWCVEHDGNDKAIQTMAGGYRLAYRSGENVVLVGEDTNA